MKCRILACKNMVFGLRNAAFRAAKTGILQHSDNEVVAEERCVEGSDGLNRCFDKEFALSTYTISSALSLSPPFICTTSRWSFVPSSWRSTDLSVA